MSDSLRIAFIAAGAGGMYCGSCIHDNTLATALRRRGHDVVLIPTYTPLRTDEENVSEGRVFYGAVNVFLETGSRLFAKTPGFLHRMLDRPGLLRWVSRFAGSTDARKLGALALGVLRGEQGPQARELEELVAWLEAWRPDLVHITNSMFLGMVSRLRERLGVPVVVALQGEDLFIDGLPPEWRRRVIAEMRQRATDADLFLAPSGYYRELMGRWLEVDPQRIVVTPLGIRLEGHGTIPREPGDGTTLGYLARISPEKGLHLLVDAFRRLSAEPGGGRLRLRVAGYLGPRDQSYFRELTTRVERWGLADRFEYVGEVDRSEKIEFLRSLDLFALPTTYREAKGLPALEALANGVPVVVPAHGSFPEMVAATGGGILFVPHSAAALADALRSLLADPGRRRELGARGHAAVHGSLHDGAMADHTLAAYRRALEAKAV